MGVSEGTACTECLLCYTLAYCQVYVIWLTPTAFLNEFCMIASQDISSSRNRCKFRHSQSSLPVDSVTVFFNLLIFLLNSKSNTDGAFMVVHRYCRVIVKLHTCIFPAEMGQENIVLSHFSSLTTSSVLFMAYLPPCVLHFCAFCWG